MQIIEYKYGDSISAAPCVLALGFFDGVHLAHRALIYEAKKEAARLSLPLAVFTFPSECTFLKGGSDRIYGTREKLKIFEALGVDITVVADFSSVTELSAEDFIKRVLISDIGAVCAVCGFNFRYGKGASGDAQQLRAVMTDAGLGALIIGEFTYLGDTVCSTLIREHLRLGNIKAANMLLGGEYFLSGRVEHGCAKGRSLGFPTVNISLPQERQIPRYGVYKTKIPIDGGVYPGLTNIGTCPTFGERAPHLETYILGYEGDLYGRELDIFLVDFLRDEVQFSSKEELVKQINIDINTILSEDLDK